MSVAQTLTAMLGVLVVAGSAGAQSDDEAQSPGDDPPLGSRVEALKESLLDLNRDLLLLEEDLLFPSNSRVSVFLSMDVGEYFDLESVRLEIADELVASNLYSDDQVEALFRGGVQRLFVGNLSTGQHEVTAFFTGRGPEGRSYKRGATTVLDKSLASSVLELRIIDSERKMQPEFEIKEREL